MKKGKKIKRARATEKFRTQAQQLIDEWAAQKAAKAKVVPVRLTPDILARIDHLGERISRGASGATATRSDALRIAIQAGLDVVERGKEK